MTLEVVAVTRLCLLVLALKSKANNDIPVQPIASENPNPISAAANKGGQSYNHTLHITILTDLGRP